MKLGKLVHFKPLEKPLIMINSQEIVDWLGATLLFAVIFLSPYWMALVAALLNHSTTLHNLKRYMLE